MLSPLKIRLPFAGIRLVNGYHDLLLIIYIVG